jgi:hypothetical protein
MSNSSYPTEVNRVIGGCCRPSSGATRLGHQLGQLSGRQRTREQEPLDALAFEHSQGQQLILGLHTLGRHLAPERAGEPDQRGHDRLIAGILGETGDEAAIDLDRIERVLL